MLYCFQYYVSVVVLLSTLDCWPARCFTSPQQFIFLWWPQQSTPALPPSHRTHRPGLLHHHYLHYLHHLHYHYHQSFIKVYVYICSIRLSLHFLADLVSRTADVADNNSLAKFRKNQMFCELTLAFFGVKINLCSACILQYFCCWGGREGVGFSVGYCIYSNRETQ